MLCSRFRGDAPFRRVAGYPNNASERRVSLWGSIASCLVLALICAAQKTSGERDWHLLR